MTPKITGKYGAFFPSHITFLSFPIKAIRPSAPALSLGSVIFFGTNAFRNRGIGAHPGTLVRKKLSADGGAHFFVQRGENREGKNKRIALTEDE